MRELAFEALVRSTLNYCGSIWDPSVQGEIQKLEMIQNQGARWVRGARGVLSVASLLRDLGWLSLVDRRLNQRLCLFYKLLNNIIDVNIDELDIQLLKNSDSRKTRGYHPNKIVRQRASEKNSPLWTSTVFRTIPQWNNLSPASLEAGSITIFKSQLSPDRSAHLPTSVLCLVRGDWVSFLHPVYTRITTPEPEPCRSCTRQFSKSAWRNMLKSAMLF